MTLLVRLHAPPPKTQDSRGIMKLLTSNEFSFCGCHGDAVLSNQSVLAEAGWFSSMEKELCFNDSIRSILNKEHR